MIDFIVGVRRKKVFVYLLILLAHLSSAQAKLFRAEPKQKGEVNASRKQNQKCRTCEILFMQISLEFVIHLKYLELTTIITFIQTMKQCTINFHTFFGNAICWCGSFFSVGELWLHWPALCIVFNTISLSKSWIILVNFCRREEIKTSRLVGIRSAHQYMYV